MIEEKASGLIHFLDHFLPNKSRISHGIDDHKINYKYLKTKNSPGDENEHPQGISKAPSKKLPRKGELKKVFLNHGKFTGK